MNPIERKETIVHSTREMRGINMGWVGGTGVAVCPISKGLLGGIVALTHVQALCHRGSMLRPINDINDRFIASLRL